ncbi:MAG: chemotaxis response regulator protein-glutamate methylesterase [Bacteroidota bacterium]
MEKIIRVLVVDDSAYIRKVWKQILHRSPYIEVVGTANNGLEALEKVQKLNPDVITLDLIMPEMNGIEFLSEQMKRKPIPVVVTSIASETGEMALEALQAGAIDFIQKPTALATEKVYEIAKEMIEKVKAAGSIQMEKISFSEQKTSKLEPLDYVKPNIRLNNFDLIVIGVSTGGPQALRLIIPQIPKNFPIPIAVVLHMPDGYTKLYAEKLNEISQIKFIEASEGVEFLPGTAILARAGRHLTIEKDSSGRYLAHLETRPFDTPHRPAVDVLFRSAAEVYGERVLGIVLTGMGSDGREGSAWIKTKGGTVFTEAEKTCVVYGMPRSVDEANLSDKSVPLNELVKTIIESI